MGLHTWPRIDDRHLGNGMGKGKNLNLIEHRHLMCCGVRTTVALEPEFWAAVDRLSADDWRQWVEKELASKPEGVGRASCLRVRILLQTDSR